MLSRAEYIWLDGAEPTQGIRSKTRVLSISDTQGATLSSFPEWGFDGSSTGQADGSDSDCILKPVNFVTDPIRGAGNYLVLCEVYDGNGQPHPTNGRARLRAALAAGGADQDPWVGFEQEYTLFRGALPLGFPEDGEPAPQGPYYCSVGTEVAFGRAISEAHAELCIDAGLMIYGTNAEVMPGQWEFQIGYRGVAGERADPLTVADHVWLGRWLLHRDRRGPRCRGQPGRTSPEEGRLERGWGSHELLDEDSCANSATGLAAIAEAIDRLWRNVTSSTSREYGAGLEERLTGLHETCSIDEFRRRSCRPRCVHPHPAFRRGAWIRLPRGP